MIKFIFPYAIIISINSILILLPFYEYKQGQFIIDTNDYDNHLLSKLLEVDDFQKFIGQSLNLKKKVWNIYYSLEVEDLKRVYDLLKEMI